MSFPTVLGPWFVVQKMKDDGSISGDFVGMEYYTSMDEGGSTWQQDQKKAMLFMSLASAARVAAAEGAEVRVLTTKEEADEFGRA